jgi:hypothetical protein
MLNVAGGEQIARLLQVLPQSEAGPGPCLRSSGFPRYNPNMPRSSSLVRDVRLLRSPTSEILGVMGMTDRKGDSFYAFHEIPCEIGGRGFCIRRLGEERLYCVRINGAVESSCECLGYLSHGRCRHILALQTLIRESEI